MSNIFDIVGEFNELYAYAKSEEEQAEEAFIDTLESLKGELVEKAANYVAVMNYLDMEMKSADEIVKQYTAIKKARKKAIQRMKDACMWACDNLGVTEIDAGVKTIKVVNNGGELPLIIDDPDKVPQNLCKVTIEPDNSLIREYLKDHECDFAHMGERGRHIEVK